MEFVSLLSLCKQRIFYDIAQRLEDIIVEIKKMLNKFYEKEMKIHGLINPSNGHDNYKEECKKRMLVLFSLVKFCRDIFQQSCDRECCNVCCCKEIHNGKSYCCKEIPYRKSYCFDYWSGKNPYIEVQKQFLVDSSVYFSKLKELSSQKCSKQKAALILRLYEMLSPDLEQKVLFSKTERNLGCAVHHSCLLVYTRDDVCLLRNDSQRASNMLRTCLLEKSNDRYEINISETGTIIKSWPFFCLDTINTVDESFARKTSALQNDRQLRERQLKNQVKNFFMNNTVILIHEDKQVKVKEMIANIGETINENGSSDVTINDARDQSGYHGLTCVVRDKGNERRLKEKQIRNYLKIFFKNNADLINHEEEIVNQENQTEKMRQVDVDNIKSIKDGTGDEAIEDGKDRSENQGLIDVIPEIFRFVEVRTGTNIVVCPATQQQVLEPFLNRFSAPDNKPSKHDTMAMEFLRLCSMHDYPSKQGPSLLRLAQAGFYYEGNGDELICFSCGVRNRNWSYGDSPNEIHQRLSPGCKFLTEGGDGNVPVPRNQPTEELASNRTNRMVETDGLSVTDSASAREPANNTAHLSSAGYSQLRSESPPHVMAIKHPEYTARSARLGSYQTFPRHMKQHPADMTDAGFYYAGFGDCCRCFHCGIGLRNWDPEDNPWIEHARWSAECPYILKMKGQAFIDLVQEAARAAEMADSDEDNEADNESASTQSKSAIDEKSGANNFVPKAGNSGYEVENNVAKMSEAEISKGTPEDSGSSAGNTVEAKPIKAPLRTAAAQSLIHDEHIKPKFVTAAIEELVKTEGWGAFSLENIRKYLKIQEDSRKSASSASNADPSMLKQENKELKDLTICKICLDEKVSIVFLPCGHLVSCPQCAPALTKCPICRKGIKGTVRTNLVEKNTLKSNFLDKNNPKTNTKKT